MIRVRTISTEVELRADPGAGVNGSGRRGAVEKKCGICNYLNLNLENGGSPGGIWDPRGERWKKGLVHPKTKLKRQL